MFNSSSWYHTWALCCTEFLCTARLNSYTAPWYSILVLHSTQHTEFLSILQTLNSICIDLTTFWRSCTYIIQYAQEFSMLCAVQHQYAVPRCCIVSRPDICVGTVKKTSGHSCILFVMQLYYITSINLRGQNGVPSMSVMSLGAEAWLKAKS